MSVCPRRCCCSFYFSRPNFLYGNGNGGLEAFLKVFFLMACVGFERLIQESECVPKCGSLWWVSLEEVVYSIRHG